MTRWYRAYEGTVTDAKIAEAGLIAGCSRSVAIAAWHCILESCATAQRGGEYDTSPRRVAVILGEPIATVSALFDAFTELGMLQDGSVTAWKQRQYESDTSTERVRKFRQRRGNGDETSMKQDETFHKRDETPPETYTETETDTHTKETSVCVEGDPSHWAEVQTILATNAAELDDWKVDFLHSIKWAPTLTKPQAEKLKCIKAKLAVKAGLAPPPKRVMVKEGTPGWDAWKRTGRRFSAQDLKDENGRVIGRGWYFESEFPPQENAA